MLLKTLLQISENKTDVSLSSSQRSHLEDKITELLDGENIEATGLEVLSVQSHGEHYDVRFAYENAEGKERKDTITCTFRLTSSGIEDFEEVKSLKESCSKLDKALCQKLDTLANGADEVEYQGKTYVRTGPKNQVSQPGPWRLKLGK
jgi:hypothetical protein